jgi:hypothetical protein
MPKALKSPAQKQAFCKKLESLRPKLPTQAALRVTTLRADIPVEHVYNVLRQPTRRFDDEILSLLEQLAYKQAA